MKKILAFSGSSSSTSINQKFAILAASNFDEAVTVIDIRDFPMPMFSTDIETSDGAPENATKLKEIFDNHDGFIIACPEFNGSMPGIFKNMIDWLSRFEGKIFGENPVLLLSTSPGQNGGRTNIDNLKTLVPWWGGEVVATFSLGGFNDEYDSSTGTLRNAGPRDELRLATDALKRAL